MTETVETVTVEVGSQAWKDNLVARLTAVMVEKGFDLGATVVAREKGTVNAAVAKLAGEFKAARRN